MKPSWHLRGLVALSLLSLACAEPPHKEMSRAEGAIEAARAAGAETYAADEFSNAQRALERSKVAVDESDYRQALSQALDAFEQAELAAATAATQKAKARGDVDAKLAEVVARVKELSDELDAVIASKVSESRLKPSRTRLAALQQRLQEARSLSEAGDLQKATMLLTGVADEIPALVKGLEDLKTPSRPTRRGR